MACGASVAAAASAVPLRRRRAAAPRDGARCSDIAEERQVGGGAAAARDLGPCVVGAVAQPRTATEAVRMFLMVIFWAKRARGLKGAEPAFTCDKQSGLARCCPQGMWSGKRAAEGRVFHHGDAVLR